MVASTKTLDYFDLEIPKHITRFLPTPLGLGGLSGLSYFYFRKSESETKCQVTSIVAKSSLLVEGEP